RRASAISGWAKSWHTPVPLASTSHTDECTCVEPFSSRKLSCTILMAASAKPTAVPPLASSTPRRSGARALEHPVLVDVEDAPGCIGSHPIGERRRAQGGRQLPDGAVVPSALPDGPDPLDPCPGARGSARGRRRERSASARLLLHRRLRAP